MTTSVYGARDFKGNIVSNASLPAFATIAALNAFTPPSPANSGNQAWVTDEARPYWWDPVAAAWKTVGGGGADYYGVKNASWGLVNTIEQKTYNATDKIDTVGLEMLPYTGSGLSLDKFPEISTDHPLVVNLQALCGFSFYSGTTQVYNRYGLLNARITLDHAPTASTEYVAWEGYYSHGYAQLPNTDSLQGVLTPFDPSLYVPVVYSSADGASTYFTDSVDSHVILMYGANYGSLYAYDSGGPSYNEVFRVRFGYNNVASVPETSVGGLFIELISGDDLPVTISSHICYADATFTLPGDPWSGFFGVSPSNWLTTYWF